LALTPNPDPINWDISPDGKVLYSQPMSGNSLFAYDLSVDGDVLPGRYLGELIPGATATDCRALCVGPTGTVWAAVTEQTPEGVQLLHLVSFRPSDERPIDHGPVAISNPNYTEFQDAEGKPLPFHGGMVTMPDGKFTTRHVVLGVCEATDGNVYILALQPYTLLRVPTAGLARS
jgi:hypothetical protein